MKELIDELKDEAKGKIKWSDENEKGETNPEEKKTMTMRLKEIWISENMSAIKEGEIINSLSRHKRTCKKYRNEQGFEGGMHMRLGGDSQARNTKV